MAKIEQINNTLHKNIRIKRSTDVSELANQNILPLVLAEFTQASQEFPICFIKVPDSEEYQIVALMGVERGENLFVEGSEWKASYMPARFTHAPFGLVQNPNDKKQFGIAMDVEHRLVSDTEGEALFNEDGTETEFMQKQKEAMTAYLEQESITKMFAKELVDAELLVTRSVNLNLGGKQMNVDGVAMVDEEKLNKLSDEDFLKLRSRGMLPSIYTHLLSMRQMNNLMRRKGERLATAQA
jgi:hypothetical protein